jgi:hypothetical protein
MAAKRDTDESRSDRVKASSDLGKNLFLLPWEVAFAGLGGGPAATQDWRVRLPAPDDDDQWFHWAMFAKPSELR